MGTQDERELDALFAGYRKAIPDPEGNPAFMPKLWQAIESRRNVVQLSWKRWTGAFVSASLALCLMFTAVFLVVDRQQPAHLSSYVDVLNDDNTPDTLAFAHVPAAPEEEIK